ncbi:hypothetical protein QBC38DRAFT_132193 [Podospora fimiseda]|uniref:Uncharacterized protein n=1 Tax=Podospora fimiseda TaxID=252190 RepID=A0AAN7BSX4_9PEZI|nr:hypothetical protein QBC38DRAFT_132193 [Podospora fimiseda]
MGKDLRFLRVIYLRTENTWYFSFILAYFCLNMVKVFSLVGIFFVSLGVICNSYILHFITSHSHAYSFFMINMLVRLYYPVPPPPLVPGRSVGIHTFTRPPAF